MKQWGKKSGEKAKKMKVAQFAAFISQTLHYQYGEKSLEMAIVGMAQDFLGSNNMPYFDRNGLFGTLAHNGKDASASRYI